MTLGHSLPLALVILLSAGTFAGLISGLLGIGGGIFLVPVLLLVFHGFDVPDTVIMQLCVGSSTATIVATSLRSVWSHHRRGAVETTILRAWAPWLAGGAVLGVLTATGLKSDTLMLIFGTLAALMGVYMAAGNPDWRLGDSHPGRRIHGPYAGLMGFVCAMMGIGGGTFGVPMLTAYGTPVNRAIATSAGFGLLISLPASVTYLLARPDTTGLPPLTLGLVSLPAFACIVAMTFLTVPLGARLTHVLPAGLLRRIFAVFIILAAINMLLKALS
ncbi:MAG: sulfite exporter TauE/SafE family protein [Pseudodonghicola sp.]